MSTTVSSVTALAQLHLDASWPAPSTARVAVVGEVDMPPRTCSATGCSA